MSKRSLLKGSLAIFALSVAACAWQFGIFDRVKDPAQFKTDLLALGPLGYVAFVALYTLLQPMGVPGTVFLLASTLIWPFPVAFTLSMIGTMGCTVAGFSFARFIAREWLSDKLPKRFSKYNDALERDGFRTVFILRFLFWMPPSLHFSFGVSKVPFWTHFAASFLAYLGPIFSVTYFGQQLLEFLRTLPLREIAKVAGFAACLAVTAWVVRQKYKR